MSAETLLAVYEDRIAATVTRRGDRLSLEYEPGWRRDGVCPLSLSMPLARASHDHAVVEPFLMNLLPDNARVMEAWGRRFGVSPRSPFRLLSHVGEDCAGAFAFVRPERLEKYLAREGSVKWLTDCDVEERLGDLRTDVAAWRRPDDQGQFSLAGAHAKIALLLRDGRWGVPSGRTPTTHILKPPIPGYDGHVENEHFSLALARALGMATAESEIRRFGHEIAIVVRRFDRYLAAEAAAESATYATRTLSAAPAELAKRAVGAAARARVMAELAKREAVLRLHQEDLCQALGVSPERKYQNDGGPTPAAIADLLRRHSSAATTDIAAFRDALLYAWLIGGTDAHAKNYAMMHGSGGRVRLAPLYDVASALPYDRPNVRKLTLAMKMGNTYRLTQVGRREIERLGESLGLDGEDIVRRARELADELPGAASRVRRAMEEQSLDHPIVHTLEDVLGQRARRCARALS